MKQAKNIFYKIGIGIFLLLAGLWIDSQKEVYAAECEDGSLTIQLKDLGTSMKDVEFILYKIAEYDVENARWIMDERISAQSGEIDLNQEKTAALLEEDAVQLAEVVRQINLERRVGKTAKDGRVTIEQLGNGMYLAVQNQQAEYGSVLPFLVAIPQQVNGEWINEVTASPKGEIICSEEEIPAEPVDTGDDTSYEVFLWMAIGAGVILAAGIVLRKRRNRKRVAAGSLALLILGSASMSVSVTEVLAEDAIPEWATNVVIENTPDDQYVYQFSDSCPLYQRGQYRFGCGAYNCAPSPIILLIDGSKYNTSLGTTWTANSLEYVPGVSNYELVYCADFETDTVSDQFYKKVNVEDSTYFESVEDAYKLRAIVGNTYPFVSAADMVKNLYEQEVITDESILLNGKTFEEELTTADIDVGQLIAATQMAIWVVCNESMDSAYVRAGTHTYYTLHPDNTSMQPQGKLNQVKGYPNADSETETKFYMTEGQAENINAIYNYLMSLAPVTEEAADRAGQLVITNLDYEAAKTGTGNYDITVKVVLNTAIKTSDNLTIKVAASEPDSNGNPIEIEKVFQSQGTNEEIGKEFSFSLKDVPAGSEITIELSGNQYLNQGVYFYEPYLREGENERTSSQNMVGASVGYTPVNASASFNIDAEEVIWAAKMPSTGGNGVTWFYSTGILCTACYFCLYINKNTKAKNKKRIRS